MAKRGETRPWKVRYQWEGQPKAYTIACTSEASARSQAALIKSYESLSHNEDHTVEVRVEYVPTANKEI